MRAILLVGTLCGCGGDGSADVKSTTTAPFELSGKTALFATDPGNTYDDGSAVLLVSDNSLDCESLTSNAIGDGLDEVVLEGEGVLFLLSYDHYDGAVTDFDFTGLWMAGYAYNADSSSEKSMGAVAYSDGFVYLNYAMYYGFTGDWLRIDSLSSSTVKGAFSTVWWSGDFSAKNCGDWTASAPRDTSWDSGYY